MPEEQKFFSSRLDYAVIVLCCMSFCVGLFSLNEISIYTPDSTRYLVWAKSLAEMAGFYDDTMPEASRYVVHAPLYPVLLAPVSFFFPESILAPKIFTLFTGTITLFLLYLWIRLLIGSLPAFLGCMLLAVHPLYLLYSTEVLSDIPFVGSLILTFLFTMTVSGQAEFRWGSSLALAMTVAASLLLREIGISVLLSVVLFLLFRKRYKQAVVVFILPVIIYAGWYVRNELIVAALEQPALTNSKMFTYHFFTSNDAPLVAEFISRIVNNVEIYGKLIGDILLFPMYFVPQYDLVAATEPAVSTMKSVLMYARFPVIILIICLSVYGMFKDVRRSESGLFRLLFFALYASVMLLYPINDIRFMVPFIVLIVFYSFVSVSDLRWKMLSSKPKSTPATFFPVAFGMLLLPNIVWDYHFVHNSHDYTISSQEFYESGKEQKDYPTHFTKPFKLAGEWIKDQTPEQVVLISQWKDLAFWIGGRKLLNVDQTISPDEFENLIRDYGIQFLVSQVRRGNITEFASQMHYCRRFGFSLKHRVGNTEIYEINTKRHAEESNDVVTPFEASLRAFDDERYVESERILDSMWLDNNRNLTALVHLAVAKECGGKLNEADSLFTLLREHPQAGMFLGKAGSHRQIIHQLRLVTRDTTAAARAEKLTAIGAGYWSMGLRTQARKMMLNALHEVPASPAPMMFQTFFALKERDTILARMSLREFQAAHPNHPVNVVLNRIFSLFDSIAVSLDSSKQSSHFITLAEQFLSVGLTEDAIDHALLALQIDNSNYRGSLFLADLYTKKRRFAPAKKLLQKVLENDPNNDQARVLLSNVQNQ